MPSSDSQQALLRRVGAAESASTAVHEAAALVGSRLQAINSRIEKLPTRIHESDAGCLVGQPQQRDAIFADGAWPDSAAFETFVRGLELSGGCTLDVTPENILTLVENTVSSSRSCTPPTPPHRTLRHPTQLRYPAALTSANALWSSVSLRIVVVVYSKALVFVSHGGQRSGCHATGKCRGGSAQRAAGPRPSKRLPSQARALQFQEGLLEHLPRGQAD